MGTIGENIREARKSKGITQQELARRIGKTQSLIGQYETGARKPKAENVALIAKAMRVDIRELFGEKFDSSVKIMYGQCGTRLNWDMECEDEE